MKKEASRRVFLQVLGGSVVVACGGGGGGMGGPLHAKDVAVGTLQFLSNVSAIVGRDAGGLYAMSSICKHESCDMKDSGTIKGTVITCNCHGSQYDANGKVLNPPSTTNLDHIELTVAMDGTISVNPSKVVPATTRVMA